MIQKEFQNDYENDLENQKRLVKINEGPDIKEKML